MSPRRIVVLARFTLLTAVSFIAAIWLLQEITSVYSFSNRLGGARGQKDFWEWETTTRFIPRNTPSRKELKEDDFLCDQFPDDILSQVQVILKVGSSEPVNRLNTQISTVTRCISNLLIVSDQESEIHGHRVHDILAAWPPSFRSRLSGINGRERGWALDRFKFLPMVEKAYEINPTARWFVFLETDTYIVWDNLFRLLDQYDASAPLYMGSPSPGEKTVEGETTWFAHGGTGFVLSRAAVTKLVTRDTGAYNEYLQPSLSMQYQDKSETNCCGDSVLGWALYEKGVKLTGLWPMFNPHALHSVPFDSSHWCRPVISMHGTLLEDMEGLIKWENERNRTNPLLYADLFEYIGSDHRSDWENTEPGGWQEPQESPAHTSFKACHMACHEHPKCLSYTYGSLGHCVFTETMRLGGKKLSSDEQFSAGWDMEKFENWRGAHYCENPQWVKPSITRIY